MFIITIIFNNTNTEYDMWKINDILPWYDMYTISDHV